jgi:hypothetical protein
MILLIIISSLVPVGKVGGIVLERLFAPLGSEPVGNAARSERVTGSCRLGWIHQVAAD